MKFIVAAVFALLAVSAFAREFETMENWAIDWSKVVPVQEMPGFWDGRDIAPAFHPAAPSSRSGRIVGGVIVTPNVHPYQVGLLMQFTTGTGLCGGSRISDRTVLTAAHCPIGSTSTQLIFGAHSITTLEANQHRETVPSTQYVIHANYNSQNLNNDVALILTTTAVPTNAFISNIALAAADSDTFAGAAAVTSGWGRISDGSTVTSAVLRSVTTTVVTNAVCQATYGGTIIASTICTSTTGGRGTCNGDSGGPLTYVYQLPFRNFSLLSFFSSTTSM